MKLTTFLRQCVLACALSGASLGVLASPLNFHVDLNTAGATSATYIDFLFTRIDSAAPATVTVSNLSGGFGLANYYEGAVAFIGAGKFLIGNGPDFSNLLEFNPVFGGMFSFDLAFSGGFLSAATTDGSTFSVTLLDASLAPLNGIVQFDLSSANGILAHDPGTFAAIAAVPEPSAPLMWLTGLGLVGLMLRRPRALPGN